LQVESSSGKKNAPKDDGTLAVRLQAAANPIRILLLKNILRKQQTWGKSGPQSERKSRMLDSKSTRVRAAGHDGERFAK
jgi:hypothetical protein